jgi:hypothetical protein
MLSSQGDLSFSLDPRRTSRFCCLYNTQASAQAVSIHLSLCFDVDGSLDSALSDYALFRSPQMDAVDQVQLTSDRDDASIFAY